MNAENAGTGFKLMDMVTVVDRFFEALGYERKRPPHLTRIVIVRAPDQMQLVPIRIDQRPGINRRTRY